MKARIPWLIASVLFCFIVLACHSQSEEPLPPEVGDLSQTVWEGFSYRTIKGEQWDRRDVTLHFYDASRVQVRINVDYYDHVYDCTYTADKRILHIVHENVPWPIANEYWYISKRTKEDLYFDTPPGDSRGIRHLELHRKL